MNESKSPSHEELVARQNIAFVYSVAIVSSSFIFGFFGFLAWVLG